MKRGAEDSGTIRAPYNLLVSPWLRFGSHLNFITILGGSITGQDYQVVDHSRPLASEVIFCDDSTSPTPEVFHGTCSESSRNGKGRNLSMLSGVRLAGSSRHSFSSKVAY